MNDLFRNNAKDLEVVKTLAYYDVLNYPLTAFEVWKHLFCEKKKSEEPGASGSLWLMVEELERLKSKRALEEERGFYFLPGRKKLVQERLKKDKFSSDKIKIVRRAVFWLRFSPFVRMIAVTGGLAMKNAHRESDLDFLVVLKKGKIFTGRLFFTFLAHLMGKRRYAQKIKDRICLNFFLSSGSLEIDLKDIYSSSEYTFIRPVYGKRYFLEFRRKNRWISEYKKNYFPEEILPEDVSDGFFLGNLAKKIMETCLFFSFIEEKLKNWQIQRIERDPRTNCKGSAVSAGDEALVFLPDPRGPKVYEKFREKIEKICV